MTPEELARTLRSLWGRIGGYTRSLSFHLREAAKIYPVEEAERALFHRKRVEEQEKKIDKALKEIEEAREDARRQAAIDYEFIDVDEETGLFIYYDLNEKRYFKVRPEEPVMPKEKRFYYNTLELTVNYAFETGGGGKDKRGRLAAEIKITVRVEKMRSKMIDKVLYWMNRTYKSFVADYFAWDFGREQIIEKGEKIAAGVFTIEDPTKVYRFEEIAPEPIKVGVYIRCSQKAPSFVPKYKYARADVFGEWSRFVAETKTTYDWRKFDLKEWLDRLGAWREIVGEE